MNTAAGGIFPELAVRVGETLARLAQARDVQVGCSPKRAVFTVGKTTLYEYQPLPEAPRVARPPLLVCFALVNRPYVLDLQPDRSLVRRLLEAGPPVDLLDRGQPPAGDRPTQPHDH